MHKGIKLLNFLAAKVLYLPKRKHFQKCPFCGQIKNRLRSHLRLVHDQTTLGARGQAWMRAYMRLHKAEA